MSDKNVINISDSHYLIYIDEKLQGLAVDRDEAEYFIAVLTQKLRKEITGQAVITVEDLKTTIEPVVYGWFDGILYDSPKKIIKAEPVARLSVGGSDSPPGNSPAIKPRKRIPSFDMISTDEKTRNPVTRTPTPVPSPMLLRKMSIPPMSIPPMSIPPMAQISLKKKLD